MPSGPSVLWSFTDFKIVDLSVKKGLKCGPGPPLGVLETLSGDLRCPDYIYTNAETPLAFFILILS